MSRKDSPVVHLDPIKPRQHAELSGSMPMYEHDKRLAEILQNAPQSAQETKRTFKNKAVSFCVSQAGLALISMVIFFILLL